MAEHELVWTSEPPTEPGWWWYDFNGEFGSTPTEVWVTTDEIWARPLGTISRPIHEWKGRWAGPIPEPRESE